MDWKEILQGIGAAVQGASSGAIVGQWLEMEDDDALNSIEEWVKGAATSAIDSMDGSLLMMIKFTVDPDLKVRLTKFYAFFKLIEFLRFQAWRGFPRV